MHLFTDGTSLLARADRSDGGAPLSFDLRRAFDRHFWGELRAGDVISAIVGDARVEILDASFRTLTPDLGCTELTVQRSGIHHVRLHGPGKAELCVRRAPADSTKAGPIERLLTALRTTFGIDERIAPRVTPLPPRIQRARAA